MIQLVHVHQIATPQGKPQYLMPWRNAFELGSHPNIKKEAIAVPTDIASAFTMRYYSLRAID